MKREFNGFHIHSTLITVIITKIILHGNKALSQVVDQNTKKAGKVHALCSRLADRFLSTCDRTNRSDDRIYQNTCKTIAQIM